MPVHRIRRAPEKVTLGLALEKLKPALRSHPFFFGLAISAGLLLLAAEHYLVELKYVPHDHLAIVMLEHLGVALVVAAIAVFGYEWNVHINESNSLGEIIKDELEEAQVMRSSLGMADRLLLVMEDHGRSNLKAVLDARLGNDGLSESLETFRDHLVELIDEIAALRSGWHGNNQIMFVSILLREFVTQNAKSMVAMANRLGEQHFRISEPSQKIAGRLLAAQVALMKERDQYDVISDFASWMDDHLEEFLSEQLRVVRTEKVRVRRIFNINRLKNVDPIKAGEILKKHFQLAKGAKGYELAILGKNEIARLERDHVMSREEVDDQHFGIFTINGAMMRFKVETDDLADLGMTVDGNLTKSSLKTFELLWKYSRNLKSRIILNSAISEMNKNI